MAVERKRLDELVVDLGLAPTRSVARGLIMAGSVLVGGKVIDKAGAPTAVDAAVTLKTRPRFVSRAGDKLAGALVELGVSVEGKRALDVGASTGGFVDCLLQNGASEVIALDVGSGQLDSRLGNDPRVIVMNGWNARLLRKGDLPFPPDVVTMDVSFISVGKVLGAVVECMAAAFEGIILVKPQFEAGRGFVGKKGIVRDPDVHRQVLRDTARFAVEVTRLDLLGMCRSSVPGAGGNVEFFLHVARGREKGVGLDRLEELIESCLVTESSSQRGA